jgi:hypothetical protein
MNKAFTNKSFTKRMCIDKNFRKFFFDEVYTLSGSESMYKLHNIVLSDPKIIIKDMPHEGITKEIKAPDFRNVKSLAVMNCHKNFSPTKLLRYKNIFNISYLYLDSDPCEEFVIRDFNNFTKDNFIGLLDYKYKRIYDRVPIQYKNKWRIVYPEKELKFVF